jgi:serine phosphatase RsbU (regulator of sigma subunit)/tetratricopeptide (TPR) repeat protein
MNYPSKKIAYVIFVLAFGISFFVHAQDRGYIPENQQVAIAESKYMVEKYEAKDPNQATQFLNKIAFIYWEYGHNKEAIDYFKRSLSINENIGNNNAITMINHNIGSLYSDLGNFDEALKYYYKTLEIRKLKKDKEGIASAWLTIADTYSKTKQYEKAVQILENDGLKAVKELGNEELIRNCYGRLTENYEKMGNAEKSIQYFKFFTMLDQNLRKETEEESQRKVLEAQLKTKLAEAERVAKEGELLNQEKKLLASETEVQQMARRSKEQQKQLVIFKQKQDNERLAKEKLQKEIELDKVVQRSLIGGLVFVFLLVFVAAYAYQQKKKAGIKLSLQNAEIMQQKEEILSQRNSMEKQSQALQKAYQEASEANTKIKGSINYARRIQDSMLPDEEALQALIPESFILFNPRDIVSGDYYWFAEVRNETSNEMSLQPSNIVFAAADCTGHGVPGALLTMIGFNLLNEIVQNRHITEPHLVLKDLHKGVRKALKQEETENRDGMDLAICTWKPQEKILEYAGANNPLIIIQNNELHYFKADKHAIGGVQKEQERLFTKHEIKIDQPTAIYAFSDGYPDQFGGANGKKFGIKALKELFLEIHQQPMREQREILEVSMRKWKGLHHKQIDDILMVGMKLG